MIGEPYAVRMVGDETIRFRKLTPHDRTAFLRAIKRARRTQLIEDLKAVDADQAQMLGELRAFDARNLSHEDWLDFARIPEGQAEIVRLSLAEYKEKADDIHAAFVASGQGELELVAELCGFIVTTKAGNQVEENSAYGDSSNPTMEEPEAYPTTPTTSPTVAELSATSPT